MYNTTNFQRKAALGIAAASFVLPSIFGQHKDIADSPTAPEAGNAQKHKNHAIVFGMRCLFIIVLLFLAVGVTAQEGEQDAISVQDTILTKKRIDPLSPSRAAFYSAVLPGLGQAYNKRYWKIPIVYAALGTGMYFYIFNNKEYNRYRDAFKSRLAGFTNDEFYDPDDSGIIVGNPDVSDRALQDAQEFYQRNRDLSLLVTIGLYVLNIIDANVDAHLKQFNIDDDLTIRPAFQRNPVDFGIHSGISLTYNF